MADTVSLSPMLIKNRNLHIIFGVTLIAVLGVASITPAFPKVARSLNLTETEVAYLISVFTLPGIILAPVGGILADRYGRKTILVPSLFLFGLAGFACFFTRNLYWLLVFRFFQGVGGSTLGTLNVTLIGDFFSGKQRAEAMGYNASVLSVGTGLYPFVGGVLAVFGWNFPFLLPLLAIPVGLWAVAGLKRVELHHTTSVKEYFKSAFQSVMRKEVLGLLSLSVLTFIILYGAFLSFLPFLFDKKMGLNSMQIGLLLSLSSFATALTSAQLGKLVRRFSEVFILKVAYVLYFISILSVPFISNVWVFLIPVVIFGIAQGLNIPGLQTLLIHLAPEKQRAVFMSVNGMVLRLGQTLGPLVIGLGVALFDINGAFYLAAAITLLMLLVVRFTLKKLKN
ncbi:MAG: MFS transporter [Bacteroidales bacterium]|nr:MFS transporter [Bacteroidales bacterium]